MRRGVDGLNEVTKLLLADKIQDGGRMGIVNVWCLSRRDTPFVQKPGPGFWLTKDRWTVQSLAKGAPRGCSRWCCT